MMGLTKRQSEALAFIRQFIVENEYSPNYAEIREGLGLTSKGQVNALVVQLAERGALTYLPRRSRSISLPKAAA